MTYVPIESSKDQLLILICLCWLWAQLNSSRGLYVHAYRAIAWDIENKLLSRSSAQFVCMTKSWSLQTSFWLVWYTSLAPQCDRLYVDHPYVAFWQVSRCHRSAGIERPPCPPRRYPVGPGLVEHSSMARMPAAFCPRWTYLAKVCQVLWRLGGLLWANSISAAFIYAHAKLYTQDWSHLSLHLRFRMPKLC